MKTVIFACVHNAGRSQIAAGFFNARVNPTQARAVSAGTHPAESVHPQVVEAMREVGIDVSAARPTLLTADMIGRAERVITMGCGEDCPYVPGVKVEDWPLLDPKGQSIEQVRAIRDEIRSRVEQLLAAQGWIGTTASR